MMNSVAPAVGLFANKIGYTDVHPFEIVRVISEKTIEVRRMKVLGFSADSPKPEFIPGGFVAHCTNNHALKYDIVSDEAGDVIRIRLGKKGWNSPNEGKFKLSTSPWYFYDYNF